MQALVTGPTGFVGRALVAELQRRGHTVRRALRRADAPGEGTVVVGELGPETDWHDALQGVDTVFHLAARVHDPRDDAAARAAFERVNVAATRALAEAAAGAGVRRFVFTSSVKVMGEISGARPFTEADVPQPQDAYGRSKLAAEQALAAVAARHGGAMAVAILRPPLVYGPGVKANMAALLRLAASPWPLPLARATAPRSLVHVGNLVDALIAAAERAPTGVSTWFVSDGEHRSVAQIVTELRAALGRRAGLWPVPAGAIRAAAGLLGRAAVTDRLFTPLQVDSAALRRDLQWQPPWSVAEALASTMRHFAQARANEESRP